MTQLERLKLTASILGAFAALAAWCGISVYLLVWDDGQWLMATWFGLSLVAFVYGLTYMPPMMGAAPPILPPFRDK